MREVNKWEVEHKQWSEKVRSHSFCSHMLDRTKTGTVEGSKKRKSFIEPVGMNGFNFKNETLFLFFLRLLLSPEMSEI